MAPKDKVIVKVRKSKVSGQKTVTIPREAEIEEGDYVTVKKLNPED